MVQQKPDPFVTSSKSQAYHRALWDNSPTAQVVYQFDGTILDTNKAFARLIGRNVVETLGLNIWAITSTEYHLHQATEQASLEQEGKFSTERSYLDPAGKCVPVKLSGVKIELEGNDLVLLSAEITEKVELEKQLKEQAQNLENLVAKRTQQLITSKARFEKLVTNVPGAIYQFKLNTNGKFYYTYISSDCEEILEYTSGEMIQKPELISTLIYPEDVSAFEQIVQHSAQTLQPKHWEGRIITPSGKTKWIQTASKPEKQADDSIVWDGLMIDISDRKQAEQELRRSQQLLRMIFDTLPQRVFWKDTNFNYLGCNQRFAQDAGLKSTEDVVGKSDFDLSWHKSAHLYRADDEVIMAGGAPKVNYEESQIQDNGTIRTIRTSKLPLKDKNGRIIGLFGSYENISHISQQKQRVAKAQDFLEKAIDSISNPIFVKDTNHNWVLLNEAYCKFLGHSKEEMLGKSEPDFYSQEQADIYWTKDELVMLSGREEIEEEPFTDQDGNEKIIVTKKSCFQDLNGNTYLLGMIIDTYDA